MFTFVQLVIERNMQKIELTYREPNFGSPSCLNYGDHTFLIAPTPVDLVGLEFKSIEKEVSLFRKMSFLPLFRQLKLQPVLI